MIVLSVSLFATDVSNFDIKGIKLGMSKNEVLKLMPKGTIFRTFSNIANNPNYPYEYDAYFDWKKSHDQFYFGVDFDHQLNAYEIIRNVKLNENANMKKVSQQVINRYGNPDFTWKSDVNQREHWEFCWGKCIRNKYGFYANENEKVLIIEITKDYRNEHYLLETRLYNDKLKDMNIKYEKSMYKKAKNELEEKASKVDL